jgi:hypothetical protein
MSVLDCFAAAPRPEHGPQEMERLLNDADVPTPFDSCAGELLPADSTASRLGRMRTA